MERRPVPWPRVSKRQTLLLIASNCVIAVLLYWPALHGTPVSDDLATLYLPQLQTLSWENLRAIVDPTSPVSATLFNYAPVHALLTALEIRLFGFDLLAFHLVNVAFHALVSGLLVVLFVRTGIPRAAALLGGLVFLVHPANVEAIAWMNELKTPSAMALAIGALLAHRRHPACAALLFVLALLAKVQAAVALPVLVALEWMRDPTLSRFGTLHRWRWVGVWALLFAAFAAVELPVLIGLGAIEHPRWGADQLLHLRTMFAVAGRYLVMAFAGYGLSTGQEPPVAVSWADPWWLGGLLGLLLLGARTVHALRRRRTEAAWWIWAAASYAPVSQAVATLWMVSDRYLYAVLPGLIGGLLLAGRDEVASWHSEALRSRLKLAAAAVTLALAVVFAVRVRSERAPVWQSYERYLGDAARHYPDGTTAHVLRARQYARTGDGAAAAEELRTARRRGWSWIGVVFTDPAFRAMSGDPQFQAVVRELTEPWLQQAKARSEPTAYELRQLAQLHLWRGEAAEAAAARERADALDRAARSALGAPASGSPHDGTPPVAPDAAPVERGTSPPR